MNSLHEGLDNILIKLEKHMTKSDDFIQFQNAGEELENMSSLLLLNAFREMGVFLFGGELYQISELKDRLHIIPKYNRLFDVLLDIMKNAGFIYRYENTVISLKYVQEKSMINKLSNIDEFIEALISTYPEIKAHMELLKACVTKYPIILTGNKLPTEVMFPRGSMELVENVYKNNANSVYYNNLLTQCAKSYISQLIEYDIGNQIRILEIGAGTGGTSKHVFEGLSSFSEYITYVYTDISKTFVQYGKGKFGSCCDFAEFMQLNIEKNVEEQGYTPYSFDIVLAGNVLHATKNIKNTLENTRKLMKSNGLIILNEITSFSSFLTLTFGMLDGWWMFEDENKRLSGSPLLDYELWKNQLIENGFEEVASVCNSNSPYSKLSQDIIIAMCESGLKKQRKKGGTSVSGFAKADFKLAGVCGHFCAGCSLYIGTQEDPKRLEDISKRINRTIDDVTCNGCRSDNKSFYCTYICKMKACSERHGVDFCSLCDEYPCDEFKAFEAEAPDRIEVGECLDRIKDVGYEKWYEEMLEWYACPQCKTINSAYDMKCRKCGNEPSCKYVEINKEEIQRRLREMITKD